MNYQHLNNMSKEEIVKIVSSPSDDYQKEFLKEAYKIGLEKGYKTGNPPFPMTEADLGIETRSFNRNPYVNTRFKIVTAFSLLLYVILFWMSFPLTAEAEINMGSVFLVMVVCFHCLLVVLYLISLNMYVNNITFYSNGIKIVHRKKISLLYYPEIAIVEQQTINKRLNTVTLRTHWNEEFKIVVPDMELLTVYLLKCNGQ